jgi:hypothetical protein
MGIKWTAELRVTFEMLEMEEPERLAATVLRREAGYFEHALERRRGVAPTGVKPGSAKVEILSDGPA